MACSAPCSKMGRSIAAGAHSTITHTVDARDRRTLPDHMVHSISLHCSKAVEYLHSNNVIHGALRPSNIFVGIDGVARVAV